MPVISMFYGIIVSLYFVDKKRHKEELAADWELASNGQQPYKIEPLK